MSRSFDEHDFDTYIKGGLDEASRKRFEAAISEDSDLSDAFEEFQAAIEITELLGTQSTMREVMQEEKAIRKKRTLYFSAGIAAALALTLTFVFIGWNSPAPDYKQYFNPYYSLAISRDGGSALSTALLPYAQGDYQKTISQLNALESANDTAYFYRAISYMAVDKPEEALADLQNIPETSLYFVPHLWYRGLAFAWTGQKDSAQFYWKQVPENGINYTEIQELIPTLD